MKRAERIKRSAHIAFVVGLGFGAADVAFLRWASLLRGRRGWYPRNRAERRAAIALARSREVEARMKRTWAEGYAKRLAELEAP